MPLDILRRLEQLHQRRTGAMPLTAKGEEILASMEKTYPTREEAERVLYASQNAGKISGIDSQAIIDRIQSINDALGCLDARLDALIAGAGAIK